MHLKQCFARSSIDNDIIFKLTSADISWRYNQIVSIKDLTCTKTALKYLDKANLLQLNRTQFSSLGIFIRKKVGNRKKLDHQVYNFKTDMIKVVLVFSIPNSFANENSQGRKLSAV